MIKKIGLGLLLLPLTILSSILERGIWHWIAFVVSFAYLTIVERVTRRRLQEYQLTDKNDLEKNGYYVPEKEWKLDTPKEDRSSLIENADDVFCFGVNAHSDGLVMHISRQPNNQVRCSLFLRLRNGKEYILPEEHILQKESTEDCTFGSSRMKLQCLTPMRKWRIFFNGILKEHSDRKNDSSSPHKHVTFTFIFSASSDIYDFLHDGSKTVLAHNAASSSSWKSFPIFILQRMRNIFDEYEQPGMIYGTVKVEDQEEKEIYMWGSRGHYMGKTRSLKSGNFSEVYGYFENGSVIHLGFLTVLGISCKFQYGYVMRPDGFIHPIETLKGFQSNEIGENMKFKFVCGGNDYELAIKNIQSSVSMFTKEFPGRGTLHSVDMTTRGKAGKGFIINGILEEAKKGKITFSVEHPHKHSATTHLAVSFDESRCQNSELTGGKGSSLGKLYSISKGLKKSSSKVNMPLFEVPKGIVVTTEAYKLFTSGPLSKYLHKFQEAVWSKPVSGSQELCKKAVEEVKRNKLPEQIVNVIADSLRKVFGEELQNRKFAVRSSATGEDTEQMSAAGQMETYLGLQSLEEVVDAVRKCWASQFDFQAVEYKRRYGQLLNTPMAVVVQEMVACEVAGVAFTCDPLNGNPSYINITANYGLGESVVSASAEPDTIILKRDLNNQMKLFDVQIGKKQTKIVMDDESGTRETEIEDQEMSSCCLTEELSLELGQIAAKIEEEYGSPRDLEWGILNKKVYLFQSRPVTSVDVDTNFELRHIFDSTMRLEKEFYSKANVGEVMPGATSPLGSNVWQRALEIYFDQQRFVHWEGGALPKAPYFNKRLVSAYRHIFFNLTDAFMQFEEGNQEVTDALMLSFFGRSISTTDLTALATERHKAYGKKSTPYWRINVANKFYMYMAGFLAKRMKNWLTAYNMDPGKQMTARQLLDFVGYHFYITGFTMETHASCSIASSNWNNSVMSFLAKANGEWNDIVYSDFAYLLSTCNQVESADIPAMIQKLGVIISENIEPAKFKKMSAEEALKWVENNGTAGKHFRLFLSKHGHRCLKEFDMHSDTWADDALPLIKMIQNCVDPNLKQIQAKTVPSFSTVISKLQTPLGFLSRLKLRWLLPNCRRAVREREFTKSILIKSLDMLRKVFQQLSEVLVKEGILPNKKLLYFLCIEEVHQLIKTRSPKIVARALKRERCHDELDNLTFPEILCGLPKPENLEDMDFLDTSNGLTMTGVAVSQGVVKATARVVTKLSEASSIKAGDILIAYSTDVGWTPYFPLLAGVVTELGGLISHGAVVAREYGLPCVVGLHGATRVFKSGDLVILDGNKGTLKRVETEEN